MKKAMQSLEDSECETCGHTCSKHWLDTTGCMAFQNELKSMDGLTYSAYCYCEEFKEDEFLKEVKSIRGFSNNGVK